MSYWSTIPLSCFLPQVACRKMLEISYVHNTCNNFESDIILTPAVSNVKTQSRLKYTSIPLGRLFCDLGCFSIVSIATSIWASNSVQNEEEKEASNSIPPFWNYSKFGLQPYDKYLCWGKHFFSISSYKSLKECRIDIQWTNIKKIKVSVVSSS